MAQDTIDDALRVRTDEIKQIITDQQSPALRFVGRAVNGATTTQAVWQIYREITVGTQTTKTFADGAQYNQIWNNRNSLFPGQIAFADVFSVNFDGINDYLLGPDIHGYERTQAFSVSFWVRPTALSTAIQHVFIHGTATRGWGIQILSSGAILFYLKNTNANAVVVQSAAGIVTINQWQHYVFTYTGSSNAAGVTLYKNGAAIGLTVTTDALTLTIVTADNLMIGTNTSASIDFYTGNLDEMAIYTTTLSGANVTAIYNLGKPNDLSSLSTNTFLASWWRMGDGDTYPLLVDTKALGNLIMINMSAANIQAIAP